MEIAELKDEVKLYKEDGGINGLGQVNYRYWRTLSLGRTLVLSKEHA
jgi:hypothetical protein